MKKTVILFMVIAFAFASSSIIAQGYTGAVQPEGYTIQKIAPDNGSRDFPGCLACALQEGEADIPNEGLDMVNGGCNMLTEIPPRPAIFSTIQIGDVYCGRGNGYTVAGAPYRDTDWYEFVLTESKTVYFSGIANFNCVFYIVDGICGGPVLVGSASPAVGTVGTATATIGPGTFVCFVAPAGFGPDPNYVGDYMITLTEADPGTPDLWCAAVPVSNWALFIGIGLILVFAIVRFRRMV